MSSASSVRETAAWEGQMELECFGVSCFTFTVYGRKMFDGKDFGREKEMDGWMNE